MHKGRRLFLWGCSGVVFLAAVAAGWWVMSLPSASMTKEPRPIPQEEINATLAALKPVKHQRPIVAIVAINDATETTDYVMPYGILRRSGVADVMSLATDSGPVKLYPALKALPDLTTAEFDKKYPEGADYVIVPAMSRDDDPKVSEWLKGQSSKRAIIIGVCAGANVVAHAGLLDGKRGTTHWFYKKSLLKKHPTIRYVPDRRLVVDGNIVTTTGITASIPMSLTLIEAIAGPEKARLVARSVGVDHWDARHQSDSFTFTRSFALTAIENTLAFWDYEELGIELGADMDEVALALTTDAWSRTYRSRVKTFAKASGPILTKNGIRIIPDQVSPLPEEHRILLRKEELPQNALDRALQEIEKRFDPGTSDLVAKQLEYPKH